MELRMQGNETKKYRVNPGFETDLGREVFCL
jgi:hypothetical protein